MRGWTTPLIVALMAACGAEDAAGPALSDPSQAAIDFLAQHAFDPADALRDRFAREVDPDDFPLRLLLEGADHYRFEDLWRQRVIDGRLVVEALVRLDESPHVIEFWLERRGDAWLIAGWDPTPHTVDPTQPAPPAGARIPPPFAPAAFRGTPSTRTVPIAAPGAAAAAARAVRVRVVLRAPTFGDGCRARDTFTRAVRAREDGLAACYASAVSGALRPGRVTLSLSPEGARFGARVVETTLLRAGLGECLARVLGEVPTADHGDCTAEVRVIFAPKRD